MRATVLAVLPAPAAASSDRPPTIINPHATGSRTDAVARALADSFSGLPGQPVVVTSRVRGQGVVGLRA